MMRIRSHTFWILLGCAILTSLATSACKRDKCKHVTCVNGTCVDGTCQCATGYFKSDCNTVINAGYDGTWNMVENCTAGADHYTLSVAVVSGSLTQLRIAGLWGKPDTILAEIAADGYTLGVARQRISNVEITADGTINDTQDEIEIHYQIYNLGSAQAFDVCTGTASKN